MWGLGAFGYAVHTRTRLDHINHGIYLPFYKGGDVGEYAGDVGEYAGDVGKYAGDVGEYDCGEYVYVTRSLLAPRSFASLTCTLRGTGCLFSAL